MLSRLQKALITLTAPTLTRTFYTIKENVSQRIPTYSLYSQAINFDSPRGGISLVTEKGPVTSSRLLIQKAIQKDSGLYTCTPSNAHPNSVRVYILNGK